MIGRDDEIRRTIQILSRRTKNNPVLIGEPGVGKTAIVEGLAQRIVNGDVPSALQNRQLIALDMGALIAGAMQVKRLPKVIVLFIDEIHTGSARSNWCHDASNCSNRCWRGRNCAASAPQPWMNTVSASKDPVSNAASNRCSLISTVEDDFDPARSERTLRSASRREIADSALWHSSTQHRYIADRFLPDKAIDLVDESAARLKWDHLQTGDR